MVEYRRPDAGELPAPLRIWFELGFDEEAQWQRSVDGPTLGAVASRLSSVPADFLDERVDITALAGDVLGGKLDAVGPVLAALAPFEEARRGAAVALWLFASQRVIAPFEPAPDPVCAGPAMAALGLRLAPVVAPRQWLVDVARREEATRLFLLWCGQRPAGEPADASRTLWRRLDSLARNQALAEMAAEHTHRLEVARRLRERRAQEAAARYAHE